MKNNIIIILLLALLILQGVTSYQRKDIGRYQINNGIIIDTKLGWTKETKSVASIFNYNFKTNAIWFERAKHFKTD